MLRQKGDAKVLMFICYHTCYG